MAQRGKCRSRLCDISDAASLNVFDPGKDAGIQIEFEIVKPHVIDTANGETGLGYHVLQARLQSRFGVIFQHRARVYGGCARTVRNRVGQRCFEPLVSKCDDDVIDRGR